MQILLVCSNLSPQMAGAACNLLIENKSHRVDVIDLAALVPRQKCGYRWRDYLYEFVDQRFVRLISPYVTGEDLTSTVSSSYKPDPTPALPVSVDDVRHYSIDNIPIGLAALSTACSRSRCTSSKTSDYGVFIERSWHEAHVSFYAARYIHLNYKYDRVYVYNGRDSLSRPFSEVFSSTSQVMYYEEGSSPFLFETYSSSIHDFDAESTRISRVVPDYSNADRHFLHDHKFESFIYQHLASLLSKMEPGALPADLKPGRPVISFFSSSPDEFFAIWEDDGFLGNLATQGGFCYLLATKCKERGVQLVIRLHPHLQVKHSSWQDEWDFPSLSRLGVVIVMPDAQFDSYKIMEISNIVLTAGSTVAIEAAYRGIPALSIRKSLDISLGCSYAYESIDQIFNLLKYPSVPLLAKSQAARFSTYYTTFGREISYLTKSRNYFKLAGRRVSPSLSLVLFIKSLLRSKLDFFRHLPFLS